MSRLIFLREGFKSSKETGSFIPSSKYLSRAMVEMVGDKQKHVLEIGPGTGCITLELARTMDKNSKLTVVEINPKFCQVVKRKIDGWQETENNLPEINLIQADVLEHKPDEPYDCIVSALPFANFEPALLTNLFDAIRDLVKPGGTFTFFQYIGSRHMTALLKIHQHKTIKQRHSLYKEKIFPFVISKKRIYRNCPPAIIFHLQFK